MWIDPESSLAITATFSAEPVTESLQFWIQRLMLPFAVKHTSINQVFQTLLDSTGVFARNRRGVNVVMIRWQDLGEPQQLEANARTLIETLARAGVQLGAPLVVLTCPCSPRFMSNTAFAALARELDEEVGERVARIPDIHYISAAAVQDLYPVSDIHDPISERLAQIPYKADFFVALGTVLVRKAVSLRRAPYKVIVVDLDNTLWTGVVGEDGWDGVRIEAERLALQKFLLEQRDQGALLAICSKNDEKDAWDVFERRPEMLLKKDHFLAWQINWEPKSANLRAIAKQLCLGTDSFIFLDDDGKECAEMRAQVPEVLTLQLPKTLEDLPHFLRNVWAFDRGKVTTEDRLRVQSYEQERCRTMEAQKAQSLEDFVAALALQVTIEPARPDMLSRVAQLTQRTNQFNTTTIRRTEAEVRSALENGTLQCITVAVTDRFGDYGNVGAVLYSFDSSALVVDSFLLSCRALGRGVEHAMVRYLGQEALRHEAQDVVIRFIASAKNAPALRFLDSLEFTGESGGLYTRSFRIKAGYASQLVYRPAARDESVQEQKQLEPRPDSIWFGAIDYSDLAARLKTVGAISAEIRSKRSMPETGDTPPDLTASSRIPRNQTEAQLASIWAEVLRLPSVSIHDDFFEMGGNSVRAVELLVRVVETFDRPDLTLSAVLEAPTVARFGAALGNRRQVRCLIPLRESGSRPPFFCVPGVGGNVLGFRGLAANLPADQPFWALQAPGLDGSGTVDDARQIAALYLDEIRTVQPHGPYFLGGGCIGGVIAFEMAQQLTAQDEEVAFLALMDAYNPAFGKMISRPRYVLCHARYFAQRLTLKTAEVARAICQRFLRSLLEQQAISSRVANKAPSRANDAIRDLQQRVRDANYRAGWGYVPAPYRGRITLFRAATRMLEPYRDRYLGWGPVAAGGIDLEVIPGRHAAFDRVVHGEILDRYLRQAQNKAAQGQRVVRAVPQVIQPGWPGWSYGTQGA